MGTLYRWLWGFSRTYVLPDDGRTFYSMDLVKPASEGIDFIEIPPKRIYRFHRLRTWLSNVLEKPFYWYAVRQVIKSRRK